MVSCHCSDHASTNKPPPGYVRTGVLLSLLRAKENAVEGGEDDHLADEEPGDPHVLLAEHAFEIRLCGQGLFRLLRRQDGRGRCASAGFINAGGDEGFVKFDCCVGHKLEVANCSGFDHWQFEIAQDRKRQRFLIFRIKTARVTEGL